MVNTFVNYNQNEIRRSGNGSEKSNLDQDRHHQREPRADHGGSPCPRPDREARRDGQAEEGHEAARRHRALREIQRPVQEEVHENHEEKAGGAVTSLPPTEHTQH